LPTPILESPPKIVIVDGPSQLMRCVGPLLSAAGLLTEVRTSVDDVLRAVEGAEADLLVIDMHLPDSAGFQLCGQLRATDAGRLIPILLLSPAAADESLIVRGLHCGADDCFAGVLSESRVAELQARIRVQLRNRRERDRLSRVRKERDSYRREAVVDTLTGLANRRSIGAALDHLTKAADPFGVLFLDVDHFKTVNDTFGHAVGDHVLKSLAECIRSAMRTGDTCGRWGGEEFVLAAPDVGVSGACALGETLRLAVQSLEVPALRKRITVSIGVAAFDPENPDADAEGICRRADEALYQAKRLGRNRVQLAAPVDIARSPGTRVSGISTTTARQSKAQIDAVEGQLLRALGGGGAGLPLLPAAAAEALRLAEDPRTNMSNIAQLVERDPPLAARFVALASSAAYSRGARVVSTQAALVRIGLAMSRDLLLQVVYERSNAELPHYQAEVARSFEHSVRTAVAMRCIARERGRAHEYGYLCGLLHDIGEARIYRILAHMPDPPSPEVAAEIVARHHERAGAEIARTWRLPHEIVDACARHHDRGENLAPNVRLVRAAEALLRVIEGSARVEAETPLLAAAGIGAERAAGLLRELEEVFAPAPEETADNTDGGGDKKKNAVVKA
jgi:diguanylate cyclase (GGDEF)-like protein/putative nucleotidyltransferase with HDIG domain